MRDRKDILNFELVKKTLLESPNVRWVVTKVGQGFSLDTKPGKIFLCYESAEGAAVHHEGDSEVLALCRTVATTLGSTIVLM